MSVGYTKRQAERLKHSLDLDAAKIEDIAYKMRRRVTDVGRGTLEIDLDAGLEAIRLYAHELKEVVDRRTRPA